MPRIVSTMHDPVALAATCQRFGLAPPTEGSRLYDAREAFGWVVRLPGLRFPLVCDLLSGLIAYHPCDGAPQRYALIIRLIRCYYDIKAGMERAASDPLAPLPRVVPASESA